MQGVVYGQWARVTTRGVAFAKQPHPQPGQILLGLRPPVSNSSDADAHAPIHIHVQQCKQWLLPNLYRVLLWHDA